MNGCAYNDEIKVGEYVRTDKGYIFTVDAERKVLSGLKFLDVQYVNIVKHDFDIKKIVEIGDYINGDRIISDDGKLAIEVIEQMPPYTYLEEIEIEDIVTHEQFEQSKYRVKEQ